MFIIVLVLTLFLVPFVAVDVTLYLDSKRVTRLNSTRINRPQVIIGDAEIKIRDEDNLHERGSNRGWDGGGETEEACDAFTNDIFRGSLCETEEEETSEEMTSSERFTTEKEWPEESLLWWGRRRIVIDGSFLRFWVFEDVSFKGRRRKLAFILAQTQRPFMCCLQLSTLRWWIYSFFLRTQIHNYFSYEIIC